MFFVWDVEGVQKPFQPGAIRRPYRVEQIDRTESIEPISSGLTREQKLAAAYDDAQEAAQPRRRALLAQDIMSATVFTIPEETHLSKARHLFKEKRFRHIPVTDDAGKLRGILSDRDILREVAAGADGTEVVREVMAKKVLTAMRETQIRDIAKVMFDERIGAMPIVDSDGQIEGILTRSDILRALVNRAPFEMWI